MTPLEETEIQSRLWHIAEAAPRLIHMTSGRTRADYETDITFQWAVDRGLLIIGEAATRLRRIDPGITAHITNVHGIIGFRNKLVHEYPDVDSEEVWRIIQNDLPLLLSEVRALLPPSP
jgi:uncharacterized protein with HEPN domain